VIELAEWVSGEHSYWEVLPEQAMLAVALGVSIFELMQPAPGHDDPDMGWFLLEEAHQVMISL
jgi:hypothetical protein